MLDHQLEALTSCVIAEHGFYRFRKGAAASSSGFLSWLRSDSSFGVEVTNAAQRVACEFNWATVETALGVDVSITHSNAETWFHGAGFTLVESGQLADLFFESIAKGEQIREAFRASQPRSIAGRLLGLFKRSPAEKASDPTRKLIQMASSDSTSPEGFVCGSCLVAPALGDNMRLMPWMVDDEIDRPRPFPRSGQGSGPVAAYKGVTP
jgi:hypothetical protein